jgi:hypothetical protein
VTLSFVQRALVTPAPEPALEPTAAATAMTASVVPTSLDRLRMLGESTNRLRCAQGAGENLNADLPRRD